MDIIIDTNFILTCAKEKIALFDQLKEEFGMPKILIPQQVINELKLLITKKTLKIKDREAAQFSLNMINSNLAFIIDLETKNVDAGIIKYANKHNLFVASLDRALKSKIKNPKAKFLTIKQKKRIIEA
jgi:rRNA-processing protein FCF1